MPVKSGQWKAEWERAKKVFEEVTKKKKPSETFMKWGRSKSGLSTKFGEMDKKYAAFRAAQGVTEQTKTIKELGEAIRDAGNAATKYIKTLDAEFEKEKKANKNAAVMTSSIKVLKADVEAIVSQAQGDLKFNAAMVGKSGKERANAVREFAVLKKVMVGAIKKGLLYTAQNTRNAKAERDDALKFFKDGFVTAARDVTQPYGNLLKLYSKDAKEVKAAAKSYKTLTTWSNAQGSPAEVRKVENMIELEYINDKLITELKSAAQWLNTAEAPA